MKVLDWIIALCGLWEFADIAAIFVPNFGRIRAFVWSHIFVGLILTVVGIWAARTRNVNIAKRMHWVAAAGDAWLILGSFVLGSPFASPGLWNDILVGGIVIILGLWAALASSR